MNRRPGVDETFVWGKDRATARALLEAAEQTDGYDAADVRTAQDGFIVPDAVAEAAAEALEAAPQSDDPDRQF